MPLMIKGNCEKTVEENQVQKFLALGFSLLDDKGKIVKYGDPQSKDDFRNENETLKSNIAEVKSENSKLKAENEELKTDNEKLKTENETLMAELNELKEASAKSQKKKSKEE